MTLVLDPHHAHNQAKLRSALNTEIGQNMHLEVQGPPSIPPDLCSDAIDLIDHWAYLVESTLKIGESFMAGVRAHALEELLNALELLAALVFLFHGSDIQVHRRGATYCRNDNTESVRVAKEHAVTVMKLLCVNQGFSVDQNSRLVAFLTLLCLCSSTGESDLQGVASTAEVADLI
jgi:hypothetical protein